MVELALVIQTPCVQNQANKNERHPQRRQGSDSKLLGSHSCYCYQCAKCIRALEHTRECGNAHEVAWFLDTMGRKLELIFTFLLKFNVCPVKTEVEFQRKDARTKYLDLLPHV